MAYEPLYVAYLIYFNRDRDYFECHEVLEELWLEQDRDPLYKALLQAAVGLYHFRNGNIRGAAIMLGGSGERLAAYPPGTLGIRIDKLAAECTDYARRLRRYDTEPFAYEDLTIEITDPELAAEVRRTAPGLAPNIPQRRGPQRPDKAKAKRT